MIDFNSPAVLSAARAHVNSARWRLAVAGLFALGASCVLNSFAIGFSWFLALLLSSGFDAMLGQSYINTRLARDRVKTGPLFLWGCAFSSLVLVAMTLCLAATGGGPGKVLAALMAGSALASVMLFLFQAPGFLLITAAPAALCLFAVPFMPDLNPAESAYGGVGAACGTIGFLAYVARAALHNAKNLAGLEAATASARERQREAEAKRAEAEQANRAKSNFLAVMTHELRTPLNSVIGYAEILQEEQQGPRACADARRIEISARHLMRMIDQLLSMASIDAGQEAIVARDTNVRSLLEAALAAVETEARASGNRVSLLVAPDAEHAHTDAEKLAASVAAIVSNAVKFTEGGLIAVTAERQLEGDRAWLAIAVSDTGRGLAAHECARVFEPFAHADNASARAKGGVGLGLAIARRMARALCGDIVVASEPGRGSTFTIRVPLRHDERAGAASAQVAAAA